MVRWINGINATEYYQSEQWKWIRELTYQMVGFICQRCGSLGRQVGGNKILHAHHKTYNNFGSENLEDLECVCSQCHKRIHKTGGFDER